MLGSYALYLYAFAVGLACGSSLSFQAGSGIYNATRKDYFLQTSSHRLDTKTQVPSSWSTLGSASVKDPLTLQSGYLGTPTRGALSLVSGTPSSASVKYPLPLQSGYSGTPTRGALSLVSGTPSHANVSNTSSETGPDVCWFLVQDTVDVRYWPDHQTRLYNTLIISSTLVTQFLDTVVSNTKIITSLLNTTTTLVTDVASDPLSPLCRYLANVTTQSTELDSTITEVHGQHITSPQAFYLYSRVKIISVPPVTNAIGHKTCVTTSTNGPCHCTFSHCNDNVFSYFNTPDSTALHEAITIQTPFVYIPPDPGVGAEAFGFVPQELVDSMAQDPGYLEKYPQLVSCLPGGPAVGNWVARLILKLPVVAHNSANELTSSTTVTIHSSTCYNQGPCSTSPAPGANAQAPTPEITGRPTTASVLASNPQPSNGMSTTPSIQTGQYNAPLALAGVNSNPYPPVATTPANPTNVKSAPEDPAAEEPVPEETDRQAPGDEPLDPGIISSEQGLGPENPTAIYQPPPQNQALASNIVNAIGGTPIAASSPDINQDNPPEPQPAPSYVVSLAPSASAVVVNGITSPMPKPANAGASPIVTINSQTTTLGAVPGLAIDGQKVIAGAPAATIQGVPISLAPSASAIVVGGSTTPLSPGQTPVITLGSQPVTASPTSQYVLGGRTLVPGAAAITISGTPISVPTDGNAVVVGGSTVAIPDAASPVLPVITLGNQVITANSASQFLVGDQTLVPGAQAITVAAPAIAVAAFGPSPTALTVGGEVFTPNPTAFSIDGTTISAGGPGVTVDGTSISLGPSGILNIGGSMISLSVNEASPIAYTIGSQVFTPNPTAFSIDGTTVSVGAPGAMVDGTVVSLGPSGILEIGSSTISLGLNAALPTPTAYTIGNQVFTPNPTAFSIDGTTISAGGPGVTIDGTIVRLGTSGILDIGSSTISLSPGTAYTVGGQIFTPNPTAFSIDGTTISAGGPGVNIDGTLVSLETSGILDIGSSKILLPPNNVYTVGGETFTPNPTAFSIDGTTISAGGPGVTIDGTVVSLGASGILDIGTSMILLPSGNADTLGNPTSLATLGVLDIGNSTIPLTTGISALTTTTPGPGPEPTSSSSQPRSTHSGGEAHSSQLRIGRLGIIFVLTCVVMLR